MSREVDRPSETCITHRYRTATRYPREMLSFRSYVSYVKHMVTTPDRAQAGYETRRKIYTPPTIPLSIGTIRLLMGLTLRDFAEALSTPTRTWSYVQLQRVETGERQPSPELLAAVKDLVTRTRRAQSLLCQARQYKRLQDQYKLLHDRYQLLKRSA